MKKITNNKAKTTKTSKAVSPTVKEFRKGVARGYKAAAAAAASELPGSDAPNKEEAHGKASVKAAKALKATPAKTAEVAATPEATPAKAPKQAKAAKEPKAAGSSKKDQVLALISRKDGASLDEIMTAMGWQRHTVRGFISILSKKGTKIESFKTEAGARAYKAA